MTTYGHPAQYGGEHFDSQTEAAWAAYFDCLGIEWEHEPETFEMQTELIFKGCTMNSRTIYTPDFYVPTWDSYVEVKNGRIEEDACYKAHQLARSIGKAVILLDGKPRNLAMYVYSPVETGHSTEIDPGRFRYGEDFKLMGHQIYPAEDTEHTQAIKEAANASDSMVATDIDLEIRDATEARHAAHYANRTILSRTING